MAVAAIMEGLSTTVATVAAALATVAEAAASVAAVVTAAVVTAAAGMEDSGGPTAPAGSRGRTTDLSSCCRSDPPSPTAGRASRRRQP